MHKPHPQRRLFLAALRLKGKTVQDWAQSLGKTPAMVSMVLSGKRTSAPISAAISRYADRYGGVLDRTG